MVVTFDAADAGTAAGAWRSYRAGLPQLDIGPLRRLVVAAAHPDDETLMAGGFLARAAAAGAEVEVLVASNGEASHPDSPTWTRQALAAAREREVAAAVARLAPQARLHLPALPDGRLADHEDAIVDRLRELLEPGDALVSTWRGDGHPDHAAVARAAAKAAADGGALHLEAPIWGWHWGDPARPPFPAAVRLDLDDEVLAAKRAAIACHTTQIARLSPAAGDEALITDDVLEHFRVGSEVLFPGTDARPVDFDAMYEASDDPWGFADRWYERRKREILLAALPRERFDRVLEIGSSTGVITEALAARADEVIGTDVAAAAVQQAAERLRGASHASVELLRLPEEWPDAWATAPFDLIVLSETGFYLAGPALERLVERSREALAPGGLFVACHWRPHVLGLDRGGDAVHRVIADVLQARRTVLHLEDDFVLEVFQAEPSASVAEADGLR